MVYTGIFFESSFDVFCLMVILKIIQRTYSYHNAHGTNKMPIETRIDETKQLSIHTVSGEPAVKEYLNTVETFYNGSPTLYEIWDFLKAQINGYSKQDMKTVNSTIRLYSDARKGGKTVFIPPEDKGFKVMELLEIISDQPFQQMVCNTIEEAYEWLFGDE